MTDSASSPAESGSADGRSPADQRPEGGAVDRTAGERPGPDVESGVAGDVGPTVVDADDAAASAASEAFQTLANEVRVAVLCDLLAAERRGDHPRSFSALQEAADVDSSAGFAYHLRQLTGQFVEETGDGYELTPSGRAAARAIAAGTFTDGLDPDQAS